MKYVKDSLTFTQQVKGILAMQLHINVWLSW